MSGSPLGSPACTGRFACFRSSIAAPRNGLASFLDSIAAACAAVCGSLPAFFVARCGVVDVLRRGATPAPRELTLRRVFVTGEVALAFVLLVSVMLLGRSLLSVMNVNPGFDGRGVLTLQVSLPAASYANDERVASFYSTLQSALEERLGPRTSSIVDEIPLTGDRGRSLVSVRSTDVGREAVVRVAGTGYFDVMHIPIVAGRAFRFLLEGYFAVRYGSQAKQILAKYYPWIGLVVALALIAVYITRNQLKKREETAVESLEI